MKKYNIGIVGCGYIGTKRAKVALENEQSDIKIVADIDKNAARSLADEVGCDYTTNWRDVVDSTDLDIVVVATTNNYLSPISLAALNNKKHVLCEKPMARNANEAVLLLEAASLNKVCLKAGFSLRHHPAIIEAYRIIKEGDIGKLMLARCRYGHGGRPGYDSEWRAKKEISGGGELLDQGVHIADLYNWFLGEPKEVVGFNTSAYWSADGIEDNGLALFRTANNQTAFMHVSSTQWRNLFSLEMFGTKGQLKVEGLGGSYGVEKLTVGIGAGTGKCPDEKEFEFHESGSCWSHEWNEFISAIKEKRQPLGNGHDAHQALKIIDAIYRSNTQKEVICL